MSDARRDGGMEPGSSSPTGMNELTRRFEEHYGRTFAAHGATARGVDWKDAADAGLRYELMLRLLSQSPPAARIGTDGSSWSLLDVGCGYGGLYRYARARGIRLDYTGIDVVESMIAHARRTTVDEHAHFVHADVLSYEPGRPFDGIVCNGLFTQKLTESDESMSDFVATVTRRMYDVCSGGIAYNLLSSEVDYQVRENYYCDPSLALRLALTLSRNVVVNHATSLFEFVVYVYR